MNRERLLKIIEDITEVISNLKECKKVLQNSAENNNALFVRNNGILLIY